MAEQRPQVLTWHVHGNYLYYLSQVDADFWLVRGPPGGDPHHAGRCGDLPWGDNVHDAPIERLHQLRLDAVLYQSRRAWEHDRQVLLSPAQQTLPALVLEHDPPQEHPTNTRHWAADTGAVLIHVTPFNALMWDNGNSRCEVIEHGILPLADARYSGERAAGIVVVNNLRRRGRRLGLDLFEQMRERVPLALVGMGSAELGGLGEVGHRDLPALMASHRFFFNPIRYTSLGLAVLEAMFAGVPVVGLATTELATVIRDGHNGFIDTRPQRLIEAMQALLESPSLAEALGEQGRRTAMERFAIGRFVSDWQRLLREVCG